MKSNFIRLLSVAGALGLWVSSVPAQEASEVEQLKKQVRQLQENFDRVQREHQEQIDALMKKLDGLVKQQQLETKKAAQQPPPARMFALTTKGARQFADLRFAPGDWFVFGAETRGLSDAMRERFAPAQRIRLPMREGNRSLNLSNAVAVVVFEAWRQCGYAGGV